MMDRTSRVSLWIAVAVALGAPPPVQRERESDSLPSRRPPAQCHIVFRNWKSYINRGADPWSARVPLDPLFADAISRIQVSSRPTGVGCGPGVRPTSTKLKTEADVLTCRIA